MKHNIIIVILLIQSLSFFGQSKDSYLPIEIGKEIKYKRVGEKSINSFIDTFPIDDKVYYMYSEKTELNNIMTMIRISNDTVYRYNDQLKKHQPEYVLIPKIGAKAGNGVVVKTDHAFKTKNGKIYDKLLVIEIRNEVGQVSTKYFKKGIGLIAEKLDGRLILIIDE